MRQIIQTNLRQPQELASTTGRARGRRRALRVAIQDEARLDENL
jgi:hypothetical protein